MRRVAAFSDCHGKALVLLDDEAPEGADALFGMRASRRLHRPLSVVTVFHDSSAAMSSDARHSLFQLRNLDCEARIGRGLHDLRCCAEWIAPHIAFPNTNDLPT